MPRSPWIIASNSESHTHTESMASFRQLISVLRPLTAVTAASPAPCRAPVMRLARGLWTVPSIGASATGLMPRSGSCLAGSPLRRHFHDKITLKSKSFSESGTSGRLYYLDLIESHEGVSNCFQLAELSRGRRTHIMMSPGDAQILADNLKLIQKMMVMDTIRAGDEEVQDWTSSDFPKYKYEVKTKLSANGPWLKIVWYDSERTRMIFMDGSLVEKLRDHILTDLDSLKSSSV
ncbi:hypothetical protein TCAL_04023 [Tigriopus californicus]|uniref:Uncharacterized protein n=1 Tax=Tigriopus californicus TaxID=6832 RepID=A0A553NDT9_TIGCA|nr:uncharacterized protein LOC131888191 [Tigriopus californicus]TRY63613.1 hypothetical protein TCAL_04023 [Tigriopus californicus]|eukprot:TCALIF_04023-PA protein Name:"Protein of unknown function" AED:0.00 eAED:0.00 QI:126/1/1/1/1/1/3/78/233